MRRLMFAIALSLCATPLGAFAQSSDIQGVISDQVDAFQSNDLDRAFSFASPTIQGIFQNPNRFGSMVERGYPMVWRPSSMTFGELKEFDDQRVQIVYYTDTAGRTYEAAYEMIQVDGIWRINGVAIREADLGA